MSTPRRAAPDQRQNADLSELASLLALGVVRLEARKSSPEGGGGAENPLHSPAERSVPVRMDRRGRSGHQR